MSSITVVVPAYDAAATIDEQLAALSRQDFAGEWEVLVADNGSRDDTVARAEAWADRIPVRVVDASQRRGPSAARNTAVASARGDLLLFCDGDDVVGSRFLGAHHDALLEADISAGAILHFETAPRLAAEDRARRSTRPPHLLGFLPYAQTANAAVRRETFLEAGGFDESLRVAEDVDLSWKVQIAGGRFAYTPEAIVHKRQRETGWDTVRQYFTYGAADVDLYLRYADQGVSRPSTRELGPLYAKLVLATPLALAPRYRKRWLRQAGRRAGRLVASGRERRLYP